MASFIGIKLANGEFYPILTEKAARQRKRLVLTTVTDGQNSVQIDLHRNESKTMKNARYIGTLVVERISPKKKGEPSIEMIIDSSADGDITVSAIDLDNKIGGERQQLNVSLRSFNESAEIYGNLDDTLGPESAGGVSPRSSTIEDSAAERRNMPLLVMLIIALLAVCAFAMWFFMFGGKSALSLDGAPHETVTAPKTAAPKTAAPPPPKESATPAHDTVAVHAEPPPPVQEEPVQAPPPPAEVPPPPPPVQKAPEPVVIQAPSEPAATPQPAKKTGADRRRLVPPVSQFNVPSPIPPDGVWYTIRWGDTLWAISEAFYRNPWDYRFLARYNGIHNPSYIISGRQLKIPPR